MSYSSSTSSGVGALPDRWAERILHAAETYFDSDVHDSLQVALMACQRAAFENDLVSAPTYLSPAEMFKLVEQVAAHHDSAVLSQNQVFAQQMLAEDKWDTVKQQEFARQLAGSFHIGGEFMDRQSGSIRFVEYHLDYLYPEPIPAAADNAQANVTLHITMLRRDDKPVVLSIAQHGIDAKLDQLELTLLLDDDDELGEKLVSSLVE
jgi:hypothetical protein